MYMLPLQRFHMLNPYLQKGSRSVIERYHFKEAITTPHLRVRRYCLPQMGLVEHEALKGIILETGEEVIRDPTNTHMHNTSTASVPLHC